jgi:hypothetical protein
VEPVDNITRHKDDAKPNQQQQVAEDPAAHQHFGERVEEIGGFRGFKQEFGPERAG